MNRNIATFVPLSNGIDKETRLEREAVERKQSRQSYTNVKPQNVMGVRSRRQENGKCSQNSCGYGQLEDSVREKKKEILKRLCAKTKDWMESTENKNTRTATDFVESQDCPKKETDMMVASLLSSEESHSIEELIRQEFHSPSQENSQSGRQTNNSLSYGLQKFIEEIKNTEVSKSESSLYDKVSENKKKNSPNLTVPELNFPLRRTLSSPEKLMTLQHNEYNDISSRSISYTPSFANNNVDTNERWNIRRTSSSLSIRIPLHSCLRSENDNDFSDEKHVDSLSVGQGLSRRKSFGDLNKNDGTVKEMSLRRTISSPSADFLLNGFSESGKRDEIDLSENNHTANETNKDNLSTLKRDDNLPIFKSNELFITANEQYKSREVQNEVRPNMKKGVQQQQKFDGSPKKPEARQNYHCRSSSLTIYDKSGNDSKNQSIEKRGQSRRRSSNITDKSSLLSANGYNKTPLGRTHSLPVETRNKAINDKMPKTQKLLTNPIPEIRVTNHHENQRNSPQSLEYFENDIDDFTYNITMACEEQLRLEENFRRIEKQLDETFSQLRKFSK